MKMQGDTSDSISENDKIRALIAALGGKHSAMEAMSNALIDDERGRFGLSRNIDENSPGFCYLRLFDLVDQRDAAKLGPCPDVASIRRFSNGRADPFGLRTVVVTVLAIDDRRVAHIDYRAGKAGLRPVQALSALSKDLRVGADVDFVGSLPDGVSSDFPPSWLPSHRYDVVCYNWASRSKDVDGRALDLNDWGRLPVEKLYEDLTSSHTRLRWNVIADPMSNGSGIATIIDGHGKFQTVNHWSSYVGPNSYHKDFKVRGHNVFVRLEIFRPARFLYDPNAPVPGPKPIIVPKPGTDKPRGEHDDLFTVKTVSDVDGVLTYLVDDEGDAIHPHGCCYLSLFKMDYWDVAMRSLGPFPTVKRVNAFSDTYGVNSRNENAIIQSGGLGGLLHALPRGKGKKFWIVRHVLDADHSIGATQSEAVRAIDSVLDVKPTALRINPVGQSMDISLPYACVMDKDTTSIYWNLRNGKRATGIFQYFESVELKSLHITATVVGGDNDTLLSMAIDTDAQQMVSEVDWVGASNSLFLAGNTNGSTVGTLSLAGDHGYGRQLKGVTIGNATPIVQAHLASTVVARAYIKATLIVTVTGAGKPGAAQIPAIRRGQNSSSLGGVD